MAKAVNMVSRTVKEINAEDLQLVALDKECFELLLFCGKRHRRKNEIAYHRRMYRCTITDKYLDKFLEEVNQKYRPVTLPEILWQEKEEEDSEDIQ